MISLMIFLNHVVTAAVKPFVNPYKIDPVAVEKDALRFFGFMKTKKNQNDEKKLELPRVNVYSDPNRVVIARRRAEDALNVDSPHVLDIYRFEERVTRILYPGQIREMTPDEMEENDAFNFPRSLRSLTKLGEEASDAEIDEELDRLLAGENKFKRDFKDVTDEDDPNSLNDQAFDGLDGFEEEEFHKDIARNIYERTFGQPKARLRALSSGSISLKNFTLSILLTFSNS